MPRIAADASAAIVPADEAATAQRPLGGEIGYLSWRSYRLAYEVRGTGDRTVVLLHGLLLPSWINGEIGRRLAADGYRVILFDLLGHGRSDKPLHASEHRLEYAGEQVVALLDHLQLDRTVIGGMSLGANVALEVAVQAPDRVRGLICEMPVLERGAPGVMLTLFPLLVALRYAALPWSVIVALARRLPRTGHEPLDAVLDTGGDARAMAAVLHGYAAGPVCPPLHQREGITAPTLIIGHGRDWIHPLNDAAALFSELPNAALVNARHIVELRARPDRLMREISAFVDRVWASPAQASG